MSINADIISDSDFNWNISLHYNNFNLNPFLRVLKTPSVKQDIR
jgi:hypothetical protein